MLQSRLLAPVLLTIASIASSGACVGARYITAAPLARPANQALPVAVSPNVVVVSIDGLRPDAIGSFPAPTLQRLIREGSYTLSATTILPSKTLPSHSSMLTGQPPERHGVLWNTVFTSRSREVELPTVFGLARAAGYHTAAFFSKPKFQALQREGTLDYTQAPGGLSGGWSSRRTVNDVARYLETHRPNLLFVHLADPDRAGHRDGWMSAAYGEAVTSADMALGRLIELGERTYGAGRFTLIVTADHGGHEFDHGSDDPRDMTIPWIAWGHAVKGGLLPPAQVIETMDTASTILWLLGVDRPADWAGEPVEAAFETKPADARVADAARVH
ncbi:MAG TPA: alkaline phosphatase family protein [Vicinamibacterales bacterium]